MTKDSLQELYVDELKDIYSAEKQLTKALAEDGQGCHVARFAKRF